MQTPPDIPGDNAVHNLGTLAQTNSYPTQAQWLQIIVTGSGTVRIGDNVVGSTRGLPIPAGGGYFLPFKGVGQIYSLGSINVYVPTGATVSVGYE